MRTVQTVLSSAARTDSGSPHSSADFEPEKISGLPDGVGYKGIRFYLDITAASGTSPTLDVKIQHKDPVSGVYTDITGASFAQKTTTGTDTLTIYPGLTAAANDIVNDVSPGQYKAVATIAGTTPSFTFSLVAENMT